MSVTRDENARDASAISFTGGGPAILAELLSWVQDISLAVAAAAADAGLRRLRRPRGPRYEGIPRSV